MNHIVSYRGVRRCLTKGTRRSKKISNTVELFEFRETPDSTAPLFPITMSFLFKLVRQSYYDYVCDCMVLPLQIIKLYITNT